GAKSRRADLSQVLQFKQDVGIGAVAVAVDDRFAFFVVFSEGPGRNALHVARAKTGTAVGIEDVAGSRFVQHGPNFQAGAELPTASMQDRAAPQKLGRFALIFSTFGKKVDRFLAPNLQAARFETCVPRSAIGTPSRPQSA